MGRKGSARGGVSPTLGKRLAQIEACERSGESLKAYAARHGLSPHTLYQAKKQARRLGLLAPHRADQKAGTVEPEQARATRFVEAITRPAPSEAPPAWRLRLGGGEVLESRTPLDLEDALRLIDRLGGRR